MTIGDQLIALGLLAIVAFVAGEICWRARLRRWRTHGRRRTPTPEECHR